jgi:hypothetical protein
MKNFWLERAEKKEAAAIERSIENILSNYVLYTTVGLLKGFPPSNTISPGVRITDKDFSYTLTMDACGPCSTIIIDTGHSHVATSYDGSSIGTVVASIDADGFPRDVGNTMITCSPQLTGFVYADVSFQKESERVEAEGWVLDV